MDKQLEEAIEKAVPDSIGRPKTLEDVLRALKNCKKKVQYARLTYEDFIFLHTTDTDAVRFLLGRPLSEQSEETKRFLHSLLV